MKEEDMDQIAEAISLMIQDGGKNKEAAKGIVKTLTDRYPLNA